MKKNWASLLIVLLMLAFALTGASATEAAPDLSALELDTAADVIIREAGGVRWFTFTPETSGMYRFEASGDYDNKAAVYTDMEGLPIAENDDRASTSGSTENERSNFQLDAALEAGTTYYFSAEMCYEDTVGDFTVTLSYLRKAIQSVEVVQAPRLTYYNGYDTTNHVNSTGACIRVTYTDGTTALFNNCENYYSDNGLKVTHNASYSYRQGYLNNSGSFLNSGTFTLTLSYYEWEQQYQAQVVSADQMPELTTGNEYVTGLSYGEWFRFTPAEDDMYAFQLQMTGSNNYSIYQSFRAYDPELNPLNAVYEYSYSNNRAQYGQVYRMQAGETYLINLTKQNNYSYNSNYDSRAQVSVSAPMILTEEFQNGSGCLLAKYTPEKKGSYIWSAGFQSYNCDSYAFRFTDSEGNLVGTIDSQNGNTVYPSDYTYNQRSLDTAMLEAGETYYLIIGSYTDWTVCMRGGDASITSEEISLGQTYTGELSPGQSKAFIHMTEGEGYYHLRYLNSNVNLNYRLSSYHNSYYGWHREEDTEENSRSYYDRVWYLQKGDMVQVTVSNPTDEEEEQASREYQLMLEKLPAITKLTVSKQPENTAFLRTDDIDYRDLAGMELEATYADGLTETIPFDENGDTVASRTGIYAWDVDIDTPQNRGRLSVGAQTVTLTYLGVETECGITVGMETLSDDLATLTAGVELTGTVGSYQWAQVLFTPEQTGYYRLTGSYDGPNSLYLYLYNSDGEYVLPFTWEENGDDYDLLWYLAGGERYLLEGRANFINQGRTGEYSLTMTKEGTEETENTITPGQSEYVSLTRGQQAWFTFTPETTARYRYYSFDNSGDSRDTWGEIYIGGTQVAYNDDGGENLNFSIDYTFQAGVTYRLMAKMLSNTASGNFYVNLSLVPDVTSLEITKLPNKTVYVYPYNDSVSFSGLTVKAVIDGETEETLNYNGNASVNTGERISAGIQDGVYDSNHYLLPGTYDVLVSYCDLSTTFQITVLDAETPATLIPDGDALDGEWTTEGDLYFGITVPADGYYSISASNNSDDYSVQTMYYAGTSNTVSSLSGQYMSWQSTEDGWYYGYEYIYQLNADEEYVLRIPKPSEDGTYRYYVKASSALSLTPERETTVTSEPGQNDWFIVSVNTDGFYQYSYQASANDSSAIPSIDSYFLALSGNGSAQRYTGGNNSGSSSIEGSSVTTFTREGNYYYHLTRGTYLLRNSSSKSATLTYTHQLRRMYPESWPVSFDAASNISGYSGTVIAVPEDAGGTYTIRIEGEHPNYLSPYAYLYSADSDSRLSSVSLSRQWNSNRQVYQYTGSLGVTLEGGKQYILTMSNSRSFSYTVTASDQVQPTSIEILSYPKQRYYYKLENLTESSNLASGMQIQVTYTDGDQETLYSYSTSKKTGLSFRLALPEDAEFNASGYLTPGIWQAKLEYMNYEPIPVPITMATIASIPCLTLDEDGQGSYSGIAEDKTGYGFIRFTSNEDGFYNMTLSVDSRYSIDFNTLYNSAYKSVSIGQTNTEITDNLYMQNATTYVRKGQTCYIRYYGSSRYYNEEWDRAYTLTVAKATDREIVPLSLNTPQQITAQSGDQWYSYTVESQGTYYLNTVGNSGYSSVGVYASPDASTTIGYYSSGYYNGNNYRYSLTNLTVGKTYYFKVANTSYDYQLVLVKQSAPVSLELLTEGDVFCSTIENNVDRSFADLQFRITYADGTTEDLTYGYNHTTERTYSLMGIQMSVDKPNWKLDNEGNIEMGETYIVRFHYGAASTTVPVIPRSIEDLSVLSETQNVTISAGESQYYRFTPEQTGYYRFVAGASGMTPGVSLYNNYMVEQGALFSNAYTADGTQYQVKVFELTEGGIYCLRVTNTSTVSKQVTFTAVELSPVSSIAADENHLPQTNYYLGIDRQYSDENLPVIVTYEDGSTETVTITGGVGISEATGLKMQTSLRKDTIVHTLGTETGEKTVYILYMGKTGTYDITVSSSETIPSLSDGVWSTTAVLASAQDSAYLKFIPEESGFYRFTMASDDEGVSPVIEAVKNSSYTDMTLAARSEDGSEVSVYLLAAKTYYLKGCLTKNSERSGGAYKAMAKRITDLKDGVQQGTAPAAGNVLYQFTADDTAYYQFTLDAPANAKLTVYNSTMSTVALTNGQRDSADPSKVRKYYAAKLNASANYLVAVQNPEGTEAEYAVHAGLKPGITSVEITGMPEKTLFYASYDSIRDVSADGLTLKIAYENGESETLAYGRRSSWGISMTLDLSALQADDNGGLLTGDYPAVVTYLDQTAEFTVQVKDLDAGTLPVLEEDTAIELDGQADESLFFTVNPAAESTYAMYTRNASTTLRMTLYDSDNKQIQTAVGTPDFSVSTDLAEGRSYILRIQATQSGQAFTGILRLHDTAKSTEVSGVNIQRNGLTVDAVYLSEIGEEVQLTALVAPADANNKNVTWSISDESIAVVDNTGKVTLQAMGETLVTVTTEDGAYTAVCRVIGDSELPTITSLRPVSGSTLGPDYRNLYALTHDNTGVEKIELRYRKKGGSWIQETWSDRDEDDKQDSTIQITLKLEGPGIAFSDGDIIEVELVPVDKSGNEGQATIAEYTVDLQAPAVQDLAGVYNTETTAVDLTWTVGIEPVQDLDRFAVYRRADPSDDWKRVTVQTGYANVTNYAWTDSTIANSDASYQYRITSFDKYGNEADSNIVTVNTVFVDQLPEVALGAPGMAVTGEAVTVNLTGTSDDVGISQIQVDFGDGTVLSSTDQQMIWNHVYTLADGKQKEDLTITVTVTDTKGQTSTATHEIIVVNKNAAGILVVSVADTDGIPVPDAPVYFNLGEDNEEIINTDRTGKVTFIGAGGTEDSREGFHKIGVLKDGYLPEMKSVKMINGKTSSVSFTLEEKEIVEGQFEAHRMTLDEIRDAAAAGYIDLNDPESYHTMQYNVTLEYETIRFNYCGGSVCGGVSGGSGNYNYIPYVANEHIVLVLKVPVAASILKEFYNVKLFIINNASSSFSLLDSQVELFINPESGMTVMEARNPALVELGDIPGQTTKEVEWILRGDKSGKYKVSADFSGTLSEFNKLVTAHFEGEKELEVRGVDDLKIVMQIPNAFTGGEFYYNLKMSNVAEEDNENTIMYLPGLNGEGELIQTSMIKQGETEPTAMRTMPETLKAGETVQRFYRITDQISKQLQKYPNYEDFVFHFRTAMVEEVTEIGVPLEIEVLDAQVLYNMYQKYRAVPPEPLTLTAPEGLEYGYAAEDAVITAVATAANNADYDLTYTWYDTHYTIIGTGDTLTLPAGLAPGKYDYHCVARATRKDNGNKADTDYEHVAVVVEPRTVELSWADDETGMTYDGTEKSVTAGLANGVGTDTVGVTVENATAVNAGTYVAKAVGLTGADAEKYRLPADPEGIESNGLLGKAAPNAGEPELGPTEYAYTITPKTVSLLWTDDEDMVYNGTYKSVTAAAGDLVEGDVCEVTVDNGTALYAGSYTATASALSNSNYQLPEGVTHDYTVLQLEAVLAWDNDTGLIYNGQNMNVTAMVSNAVTVDGVKDDVAVTVSGGDGKDANTEANPNYTATATALTGETASNYKLPDDEEKKTHAYVIAPKAIGLNWTDDESMEYDKTTKTVTVAATGLVGNDECTVTAENASNVAVGTYTATAVAVDNTNYCLPEEGLTYGYEITPRTVELVWNNTENLVYDGQEKQVTASVGNALTSEGVTDDISVTVSGGNAVNAGEHTATAATLNGGDAANYRLPENNTCTYTIAPKGVSVSFAGVEERVYDGEASHVTASVTAGELIGDDTATVAVTGGSEVNAGTHTAEATGIDNSNYALTGTLTQDYVITPKTAELAWTGDADLVYSGAPVNVTASVSNALEGDEVHVTVTDGNAVNAGEHTATATALDNTNYQLPENAEHNYTIAQLEAELVWTEDATGMAYDGTMKNVTAAVGNLKNEDEVTVTVDGGQAMDVGDYTATAIELTGDAADNYKLPAEATYNYRIAEKLLGITWTDPDSMVYDGSAKTVSYVLTGILEGEECTVTAANLTNTNAGAYTATLSAPSNPHYALNPAEASHAYTITPKTAELEWSGFEATVYNGQARNVAARVTNAVVIGEEPEQVNVTVTGGDKKDAGEWTAVASALSNANYQLPENASKTYTIAQKEVTVTFAGYETRTYDGTASNVTANVKAEDLIDGDTAAVTVSNGNEKNAGTYTAKATGLDNTNYVITGTTTQEYTISQLTAVLAWRNTEGLVYDGQPKNVMAIVTNAVQGDTPTVTVTGGNEVNAGTYTARATAIDNANYKLPNEGLEITYTISGDTALNSVISLINALPENITLADAAAVEAARAAYNALSQAQRNLIPAEVLQKLVSAETQITTLNSVINLINALPENITLADAEAVAAARAAYNALSEAQRSLIPAEVLQRLTSAEEQITALSTPPEEPAMPSSVSDSTGTYAIGSDGTATFSEPTGSSATVNIPDTITVNGKAIPVETIGDNAFSDSKQLKTVTIGKNVKTIGKNAFKGCVKLAKVKGGKNVRTIKDNAFSGCKVLKSFPTMSKLQKIGASAFKGCVKLTEFTLAKTVKSIGKNAFNGCKTLKTITVKTEKLTKKTLGKGAFKGINKKATFKVPKKLKKAYSTLFVKTGGAPKTCNFKK